MIISSLSDRYHHHHHHHHHKHQQQSPTTLLSLATLGVGRLQQITITTYDTTLPVSHRNHR